MKPSPYRWVVLGVFVLSTAINYLDRQTLATLAPLVRAEFHLSNAQYGLILALFSIAYAGCAPFAGMLIDRIGLNRAIGMAVGVWSCAGISTGFTRGLGGLLGCRGVLGMSEAAGIPAAGKAIYRYLLPAERALGNAWNQAGVSLGLILAPPVATWMAMRYGWRQAFVVTGSLGLIWIPLWNLTARKAPRQQDDSATTAASARHPEPRNLDLLRSPLLWGLVAANALNMSVYSLWTNWTTLYLVEKHRLALAEANWYAIFPPLVATLGGFGGGWLSLVWMRAGVPAMAARTRVCLVGAMLALPTALIPLMPRAGWTAAGISLSLLAVSAVSVNMYTMPLDVFGGARAAFAVSMLVASYGAAQALISPAIGAVVDAYGYGPVCLVAAFMPLAAWAVLRRCGGFSPWADNIIECE
ncbi:MAG TPA: MFS transporter [Bryobacteraceae bacterium]|nr:MFS transporter [Bryobacteraceae bacterium]